MKKETFIKEIDNLIAQVDSIDFDDTKSARLAINSFKIFVATYRTYLGQFVLEHIGITERYFDEASETKNFSDKVKVWNKGLGDLRKDIASMKSENSFPEETIE